MNCDECANFVPRRNAKPVCDLLPDCKANPQKCGLRDKRVGGGGCRQAWEKKLAEAKPNKRITQTATNMEQERDEARAVLAVSQERCAHLEQDIASLQRQVAELQFGKVAAMADADNLRERLARTIKAAEGRLP